MGIDWWWTIGINVRSYEVVSRRCPRSRLIGSVRPSVRVCENWFCFTVSSIPFENHSNIQRKKERYSTIMSSTVRKLHIHFCKSQHLPSACNELQQQGIREIYSSWHALNETSQHWHHRFGFTDVYNQYFIQRKFSWYRAEIKRLESQNITEGVKELRQQKDRWYSLMDEKWQSFSRQVM